MDRQLPSDPVDFRIRYDEDYPDPVVVMSYPTTDMVYSDENYELLLQDNEQLQAKYEELTKTLENLKVD
jgi:hypothetical protein